MEFVDLKGGLVVPTDVLGFALALEERGIVLESVGEALKVRGPAGKPELSEDEIAFIKARKAHLLAVAAYRAPIHTDNASGAAVQRSTD